MNDDQNRASASRPGCLRPASLVRFVGRVSGFAAASAALLCFFRPWAYVGLTFLTIDVTGYDLAAGVASHGRGIVARATLLLVPLGMCAVMAALAARPFAGRLGAFVDPVLPLLLIAAGASGVLALVYQFVDLRAQAAHGGPGFDSGSMTYNPIICVLACGLVAACGVLDAGVWLIKRYE